jgi:multiple sugar transport system permease protein
MSTAATGPGRAAAASSARPSRDRPKKEPWLPKTRLQRERFTWGLIFTSPALIGLVFLTGYPVITSLVNSFTSHALVGDLGGFVGLDNYRELLADGVPLNILVALVLALLLNMNVRGKSIYRTIFFIPSIVPIVAAATIWLYVLDPQFGILNSILGKLGIAGPGWLNDPSWSKPALLLFGAWGVGNLMIILLAGLQGVPVDLKEQAQLDGSGRFKIFRHVEIPFISPHLMFALITGLIGGFQYFTQAYVLTGGNGNPAGSTLVSGVYLYAEAFYNYRLGYASAIGWVLFAIIAVLTLVTFGLFGKKVYYGGKS